VVALESLSEWLECARRGEDLGYSSLLISDHVVDHLPVGGASPLMALAWAATATSRIRIGTIVLCNDFRHPAVLAKDAATLDLMSGGRLELGVGAGWHRADYDSLGLPFGSAGVRIDRLAEALEVITGCWSGRPFSFSGTHYAIRDYVGAPILPAGERPRLMVGGGSPRILRLAGRHADIVGVHVSTAAPSWIEDTSFVNMSAKVDWVREGAGDRARDIEMQMSCVIRLTDGSRSAFREAAREFGVAPETLEASAMVLVGDLEQLADGLRRRRAELGISYFLVNTELIDDLAPLVADLAGS
jgi:probable F420-dependent oxidoreductase